MRRPGSGMCCAVLAAVLYLGGALWTMRVVLPAPATTLAETPHLPPPWGEVSRSDQYFVLARITHNARLLLRAPWRVMDGRLCWPLPRATTLSEHMIGDGLLGVVPDLLIGEPILTFNVVLVLLPLIAGLAMYALVLALTASPAAALVAGTLFALHPSRLGDTVHPYVNGNHWAPLALLFAHRLFVHRRWADALGLAVFVSLQLLESFYAVVAITLIGGAYGLWLLGLERRALRGLAPKLLAAGAVVTTIAILIFRPYLITRAAWTTLLSDRSTYLFQARELRIGGFLYPGTVMAVLAAIGILDRMRGPRRVAVHDPRGAFLVGGVLVLWTALAEVRIPVLDVHVPSLFTLASGVVPGLDAVRGGGAVSSGFYLVLAVLAGFGVQSLLGQRAGAVRLLATAALVATILLEVFDPALARVSFGRTLDFTAYVARPDDAVIGLYAGAPDGAVLDIPMEVGHRSRAHFTRLSAYHDRPVAACYGSYPSPLEPDLLKLAMRVTTDPNAATSLYALGFRTVATHVGVLGAKRGLAAFGASPYLVPIARTALVSLFRLDAASQVDASIAPLVAGADQLAPVNALAGAAKVPVPFRNGAPATYRHPDPIVPTDLRVRWHDATGVVIDERTVVALLPLALAPGETTRRMLDVPVPSVPGDYRLIISPTAAPAKAITSVIIHVVAPKPA